jgi:hypothetical protein
MITNGSDVRASQSTVLGPPGLTDVVASPFQVDARQNLAEHEGEQWTSLGDAMRRVASEEDSPGTDDKFQGGAERNNILMFPIRRRDSTAN